MRSIYGLTASLAFGCFLALVGSSSFAADVNPRVEVTVASRGKIVIELYKKEAPKTVGHFLSLIKSGFYDGILFHRVVPEFVVQAGDPGSRNMSPEEVKLKDVHSGGTSGLGAGGSGMNGASANIPFETNEKTHEPGTLSMALSGPRTATGDSQFFINLKPNHTLDGDYCVFGKVMKGMDIVLKIKRGDKIVSIRPVVVKKAAK